ncbi:MAG: hypothetical protein P4L46_13320 [Fimbriimonas sp.]|nr:hypothetical protein [Fimbriimonas sp.]
MKRIADIVASCKSGSQTASLEIDPASLLSVAITPGSLAGGASATGTVTLTGQAGAGGTVVKLSSSLGSTTLPASVTVANGKTSATFTIKTTPVSRQSVATMKASLGATSVTATLTVNPPFLVSLSLSPTSVKGGKSASGTVTIGSAAPVGGLSVALGSNLSSATVPATVTIAAGKTSVKFTVSTLHVTAKVAATITANLGGATKKSTLTLTP